MARPAKSPPSVPALQALVKKGSKNLDSAAKALGIPRSHLSSIILYGVKTTQAYWEEKPKRSHQTRMEILQNSPGWPEHGASFMQFYKGLELYQGQHRRKQASHAT